MPTDNWEHSITQMTGWRMPERKDILERNGASNSPWVDIEVKRIGNVKGVDDLVLHPVEYENGYHLEFFHLDGSTTVEPGSGVAFPMTFSLVSKWQVDINFVDNQPAKDFLSNGGDALTSLVHNYTSVGKSTSPAAPSENEGVDLTNFVTMAASFDRAGHFFKEHTDRLELWKKDLGDEKASWKGTAAGAFYHLLDDLHAKYENYTKQLILPDGAERIVSPSHPDYVPATLHANSVITAEKAVYEAYEELLLADANFRWLQAQEVPVLTPDGQSMPLQVSPDPWAVLRFHYRMMAQWINTVNAQSVAIRDKMILVDPNFSEASTHGAFIDTSHWANVAIAARDAWTKNVEKNLDTPARTAVANLQGKLNHELDPGWNTAFAFQDTSNTSLVSEVNQEIQEKKGDEFSEGFNKLSGGINDGFNNFNTGLSKLSGGVNDGFNNFNTGLSELSGGGSDGFNNFNSDLTGGGGNSNPFDSLTNPSGDDMSITKGASDLLGMDPLTGGATTGNSLLGGLPAFSTGLPISNIDGSSTLRTGTGVTTNFANGSSTTRNADGSLTTKFPDGSIRTVTPAGEVTTVDTNGHSVTSHLGVGESVKNPDGTSITRNADGSLTQTAEDGTKTTTFGNGTSEIIKPDGQTQLTSPDGTVSHLNPDGSLTTDGTDGTHVTVHPNGDVTTTDAQGHATTSHIKPGQSITNSDGSTTTVDSKGDIVTHHPDGSTTTLHPNGTITTTNATGHGTGTNMATGGSDLSLPNDFPTVGGADKITHLPNGTTVTQLSDGSTHTAFSDGSGIMTSSDGQYQALPSPAGAAVMAGVGGTGVGAGAAAGMGSAVAGVADSQNALGLLSPMMMMAGMNRMGGQQPGGGGGGERNRDAYDDQSMDGAVLPQGMGGFRPAGAAEEEAEEWEEEETDSEELLGPRRPATEAPYGYPGTNRVTTQSGKSWSSEGKDVWGTEDGGLPASIGH